MTTGGRCSVCGLVFAKGERECPRCVSAELGGGSDDERRAREACNVCGGVGSVWTADPNVDPDADRVPCPTCPRILEALRETRADKSLKEVE